MSEATPESKVITSKLREGFFEDHDPQVITLSHREYRDTRFSAREVVVHCDLLPLSILAQSHPIYPLLICYFIYEQLLNQIRILCKRGYRSQQPRVSKRPLNNFSWTQRFPEQLQCLPREYLGSSQPFYWSVKRVRELLWIQRGVQRREICVDELHFQLLVVVLDVDYRSMLDRYLLPHDLCLLQLRGDIIFHV